MSNLRWTIGKVTVTRVVELELPGLTWLLPDATPENLQQLTWLKPHFVTEAWDPIASIHAFIVESGDQRIMVDTCIGNDKNLGIPIWKNRQGPFLTDLASAGFPRESIDTVLCTHLHPDHVGWNTMKSGGKWVPTFPKASYLFGRVEWEHWDTHRDKRSTPVIEESIDPIVQAGRHTLVETNHRLTDEVWLEPTPGHTPGHVSVRIESEGVRAVITGDLMHHPCQIGRPHWQCKADDDAERARATRKSFVEQQADAPVLVLGTHFPAPTGGRIVRDRGAFRFVVE